ncbi:hypothetical protein KCH_76420 [Kitasatospora cheerisanensis KCTC 2395]|uniref:Methyltransferase n=1 Tax=Kitasatospora cheerisanensis KCTC 2395 TaxID=1348663 RepID=A0A066YGH3_9ACTN|nr:hypothetical protein KCH_76420 [Kitasatospora cheerisanensis KCTC 2395]
MKFSQNPPTVGGGREDDPGDDSSGRARADSDRSVPPAFSWVWAQDGGPGAEILGTVTRPVVVDLGSGAARHAAHRTPGARVDAVDFLCRPALYGARPVRPPRTAPPPGARRRG